MRPPSVRVCVRACFLYCFCFDMAFITRRSHFALPYGRHILILRMYKKILCWPCPCTWHIMLAVFVWCVWCNHGSLSRLPHVTTDAPEREA